MLLISFYNFLEDTFKDTCEGPKNFWCSMLMIIDNWFCRINSNSFHYRYPFDIQFKSDNFCTKQKDIKLNVWKAFFTICFFFHVKEGFCTFSTVATNLWLTKMPPALRYWYKNLKIVLQGYFLDKPSLFLAFYE